MPYQVHLVALLNIRYIIPPNAVRISNGMMLQKTDKVQQFKDLQVLTEQLKKGDYCTTDFEVISNPTHVDSGV